MLYAVLRTRDELACLPVGNLHLLYRNRLTPSVACEQGSRQHSVQQLAFHPVGPNFPDVFRSIAGSPSHLDSTELDSAHLNPTLLSTTPRQLTNLKQTAETCNATTRSRHLIIYDLHHVGCARDGPQSRRRLCSLSQRQDQMRLRKWSRPVQELRKRPARVLSAFRIHEPWRSRRFASSHCATRARDFAQRKGIRYCRRRPSRTVSLNFCHFAQQCVGQREVCWWFFLLLSLSASVIPLLPTRKGLAALDAVTAHCLAVSRSLHRSAHLYIHPASLYFTSVTRSRIIFGVAFQPFF